MERITSEGPEHEAKARKTTKNIREIQVSEEIAAMTAAKSTEAIEMMPTWWRQATPTDMMTEAMISVMTDAMIVGTPGRTTSVEVPTTAA